MESVRRWFWWARLGDSGPGEGELGRKRFGRQGAYVMGRTMMRKGGRRVNCCACDQSSCRVCHSSRRAARVPFVCGYDRQQCSAAECPRHTFLIEGRTSELDDEAILSSSLLSRSSAHSKINEVDKSAGSKDEKFGMGKSSHAGAGARKRRRKTLIGQQGGFIGQFQPNACRGLLTGFEKGANPRRATFLYGRQMLFTISSSPPPRRRAQ